MWAALSDTDRLNRTMGFAAIEVEGEGVGAARFTVSTRLGGLRLRYREMPFEWHECEYLRVRREFLNGPVDHYEFELRFADREGGAGCNVEIVLSLSPRTRMSWPLVWMNLAAVAKKLDAAVAEVDANLAAGRPGYGRAAETEVSGGELSARRERCRALLSGGEEEILGRLVEWLRSAEDADLARIRPFELARDWGTPPRDQLKTFLKAVVAGLLELRWEIICPSCRTSVESMHDLDELGETSHCQLCDLSIGVTLDRSVEAIFRPAPAIRAVATGPFCIGGPARSEHVFAQALAPIGAGVDFRLPAQPGRYRLFIRGGAACSIEVQGEGDAAAELSYDGSLSASELSLRPGAALRIVNRSGEDTHLKIEHLEWASLAATASDVASTQTFRDLFGSQVLRSGVRLAVTHVVLLFTDLANSTAYYAEVGDAAAYNTIQEHFSILRAVVESHGGSVIKTIGDAIMSSFSGERDATAAASAMQIAYREFARETRLPDNMKLRVGGYGGPCYMVTSNGSLDYFGQTVNIAGRAQTQAEGGQVVLPAFLAAHRAPESRLRELERFQPTLKGVNRSIELVRFRVEP